MAEQSDQAALLICKIQQPEQKFALQVIIDNTLHFKCPGDRNKHLMHVLFISPVLRLWLKMAVGFWVLLALLLVVMVMVVVEAAAIKVKNAPPPLSDWEEDVVVGAGHLLEHYLAGCHVVIAAPRFSPALGSLLRSVVAMRRSVLYRFV